MIVLTAEQRIQGYEFAIKSIKSGHHQSFVCILLDDWFDKNGYPSSHPHDILDFFPEFSKYRPMIAPFNDGDRWWECDAAGNAERIRVLSECIAECNKQLQS